MRIEIRFVRMRIPCGRRRFDSIRIECAFDPDKCARVDTPTEGIRNCAIALPNFSMWGKLLKQTLAKLH